MSVKIRLKRLGKTRAPFYRVVVADERTKRNGRVIEEIGTYDPTREPSVIQIESERAQYWLSVGAQPTEAVAALLKLTGDWGKFKGEGPTESQVKPQAEKEVFEADANKKPVLKPKAEPKAEEAPTDADATETDTADEAAAEDAAAEAPAAEAEETQE